MVVLELGRNQFGIDDPVSSALRSLERVPDEKLGASWASAGRVNATAPVHSVASSTARLATLADGRTGHTSVNEPKGVLSLSTSSSSSAPSAPIEVLPFRETEPPRRVEARKKVSWSALDALVVGVAVLTIVLSALALAWFLVT
jgi:hypothetical protein